MYKHLIVASILVGAASQAFAAKNRPDGYTTICKVGNTCSVSQSTNVAFGASDKFVFKVLNGSFSCSVSTFGSDPIPEKSVKECSIPSDGSGGGSSSSGSSSSGSSSSSSSSGGGSSSSSGGRGASCNSSGSQSVSSTIKVTGTYDGRCKTFNPTSALGDGSQSEGQKPVFRVEDGGTLKNVIIGNNGADGIHFYGGGTAENITWKNVGEDALTVKSKGNVTVRNIEGYDGSDKFIQVNAETNLNVSNCIVKNMGKFLRQNGGKTFPISVTVNNCEISNMGEGVFRSDSSSSTARISNSTLNNSGKLCIGAWKSCSSN